MSLHDVWQLNLDFLPQKSICIEPVEENLSTDAGLLIFRQWDQQQGFTEGLVGVGMFLSPIGKAQGGTMNTPLRVS